MSFLDMDNEFKSENDEKYLNPNVLYRYDRHSLYKEYIPQLKSFKYINKQLAKNIHAFIRKTGSINTDVKCLYARGMSAIIMNNVEDYYMLKYLLYLGANPNSTTSREGYTLANFIECHNDEIDYKAKLFALLIEYGIDIYLKDGDVGEDICHYLENKELLSKVIEYLN
jgi:hypothetical protein